MKLSKSIKGGSKFGASISFLPVMYVSDKMQYSENILTIISLSPVLLVADVFTMATVLPCILGGGLIGTVVDYSRYDTEACKFF